MDQLSYFRIIVLLIGSFLFLSTWIAKFRGQASLGDALRWSVVWGAMCYLALDPSISNRIASAVGIDSGRFLVLYCAVIFLSCCLVLVYARTRRLSREITLLVREVAIQREDEAKTDQAKDGKTA
ncbi:MAG: hypothetical protein ACI97A_000588 [Planctomycetota bacterium]|jgi:hypothetical protein